MDNLQEYKGDPFKDFIEWEDLSYPPVEPNHMDMSDMPYVCPHSSQHQQHIHYTPDPSKFDHYWDCDPDCIALEREFYD